VQAVEHWDAGFGGEVTDTDEDYADRGAVWELVEIDTNYKPSRPGQHPVRLTRPDAVKLAGSVLEATEDTFHYLRCGRLRPIEAKELLEALQHVEYQLNEIREHALGDLLEGVGLSHDPDAEKADTNEEPPEAEAPVSAPIPAWRGTWPAETTGFDEQLAAALGDAFPVSVTATIIASGAFGALAYKVSRCCQEAGETPAQVLNSVSADERAFALHADDPAAFLASRIES
jgi:hypothetical protein